MIARVRSTTERKPFCLVSWEVDGINNLFFYIKRKREIKGKAKTRNINMVYEKTSFYMSLFSDFYHFVKMFASFFKKQNKIENFLIDLIEVSWYFHLQYQFFKGVILFSQFKKPNLNKKISKHFFGLKTCWRPLRGISPLPLPFYMLSISYYSEWWYWKTMARLLNF